MAKLKPPGPLNPHALPRVRGEFLTYISRDRLIVQKWPRKRGKANEGYNYYRQWEFKIAAQWASDPEPIGYQTALELVKGSDNVPRDLIMMTEYGTFYEVRLVDGRVADWYRDVVANAQLTLDEITDIHGSIVYRAAIGWLGLPPGSQNFVLTMRNGFPLWMPASQEGPGVAHITTFDAAGTAVYTVPEGATILRVILIGGGGGGGSGRRTASGTAASGGGGGGGAAVLTTELQVANLPAMFDVNIGAGGAGGPAQTVNSNNGSAGAAGGATSLELTIGDLRAGGGGGGGAGFTGTSNAGAAGSIGNKLGGAGGQCAAGAAGSPGGTITNYGATGGGGGGGMPAAPADRAGAASGGWTNGSGYPIVTASGGAPATPTAPQNGITFGLDFVIGGGGGGGYARQGGQASAGGNGAAFGGGGGGGGASLNGEASGKGGDGGSGAAVIIAW